jgi:hypothetical protein
MAALVAARSQTAIGAFSRRVAIRRGKQKAHMATARKLAELFYRAVRYGVQPEDPGASSYEEKQRLSILAKLTKKAKMFGFSLVESEQPSSAKPLVRQGVT